MKTWNFQAEKFTSLSRYMRVRCIAKIEWCTRTTMAYLLWCILLCLQSFFICCLSIHHENDLDIKVLNVGEELERESLPLNLGQCIYGIHGLKESVWYEVKISYPASIPASFSIQLKRDLAELWLYKNRRLLNTEKVIFKYDNQNVNSEHSEMYALVTVEAEGIVAKPHVQEREVVFFNIVCEGLSLGIPHKAWWVGIAAILCLVLASLIPYFLPLHMLLNNQGFESSNPVVTKSS